MNRRKFLNLVGLLASGIMIVTGIRYHDLIIVGMGIITAVDVTAMTEGVRTDDKRT